jgi:serine/threonine protein kinase
VVPNAAASVSNQVQGAAPLLGTASGDRLGADGRYELVERIGSGGMGAVWRAHDHKLDCDRAVKVLDARYSAVEAFVKRFRREAKATLSIAHPNVVAVLDVAEQDERPIFLVMELLGGKTLSQMVKGNGRLPWSQVQRYIDQVAAGLGAAHAQDVVHRDVKPGNCLVLPDGQLKILDFGIASVRDEARLTAAGEIIGTCSYMAPEQIKGQVDRRSDIYALGVLTFRLLTGRVPFSHREQDKVLLAHLSEPPPAPSSLVAGLPAGVDAFVLRMLAKQPHQRYGGMEELRRVLAGIERGAVVTLDGPTASPPSSRTEIFEDALTRAVVRDATPHGPANPVRVSLNTAPAGSGTLAKLEAEAQRMAGTVVLEDLQVPASGGTVVVHDPSMAAVPPPSSEIPPRAMTVPAPVPRQLGNLSTSGAAPRVTRFAAPGEDEGRGGMMRGVVAAVGGIALAAAVVAGWVMWKRNAAETSVPAATVPAAAAVVVEGPEETPEAEGPVAAEALVEAEDEGGVAPLEPTPPDEPIADGKAIEGPSVPNEGKAADGSAAKPEVSTPEITPSTGPKTKKRRNAKTGETKTDEPTVAEPEPEPEPDEPKKKKKAGDLRDPF